MGGTGQKTVLNAIKALKGVFVSDFSQGEIYYTASDAVTGSDTINLHFPKGGSTFAIKIGRNGIAFLINGTQIWKK